MTCKICGSETRHVFTEKVLGKYSADFNHCGACGFLFAGEPHWINEAYSDAIVPGDTGLVQRNIHISQRLTPLFFYLYGNNGAYIDLAGGTGLLVRLMRDAGFDFYWNDTYCTNTHAVGFKSSPGGKFTAVTAFEVLEHLVDPFDFVANALNENHAQLFTFSTELYSGNPPKPQDWWYYAFQAGQHISFYQLETLMIIAKRLGLEVCSYGGLHFIGSTELVKKINFFYSSKFARLTTRYRMRRALKSKTFDDHILMIGKESS